MDKPKVYVAHTLRLRDAVAEKYFPILEKRFEIIDPFRDRRKMYHNMTEEEIREFIQSIHTPSWPVVHDLKDISGCDVLLMINTDGPSYGSTLELAFAHQELHIPCIAIVQKQYVWHPWLIDYCITVTDDVDKALYSLFNFFGFEYEVEV